MENQNTKRILSIILWFFLGALLLFFAVLSAFFLGDAIVALMRMVASREGYSSSWSVEMAVTLFVALSVSLLTAVGGDVLIAFKLKTLFKANGEEFNRQSKPNKKQFWGGAAIIFISCVLLVALVASAYGLSSGSVSLSQRFEGAPWVSRVVVETVVSAVFLIVVGAGIVICSLWWKGIFKPHKENQRGLSALTKIQKMNLALYALLIVFFVFLLGFVLWLFA